MEGLRKLTRYVQACLAMGSVLAEAGDDVEAQLLHLPAASDELV